jgi:hypothetical protein
MILKNNLYLSISLLLMVALLSSWFFLGHSDQQSSVNKNLFKIEDQSKIDRVIIKGAIEEVRLHFDGSKWMINNSFEVDRKLIQVFFATLLQAEPRRRVAQKLKDSVHQQIMKEGMDVQLYQGETLLKNYRVLGNNRKTETYYELYGESTPYVVAIPGYRVYVGAIFELNAYDWRDKRIFNFNWQNFKRLTANFQRSERESFSISFQGKFFGIDGYQKADTTQLNDYLDAVSLVQAVQYVSEGESTTYDSLLHTPPYFSIEVTDIANRIYLLDVFQPNKQDPLVLGRLGDGQALLIRREDFMRLDRKRSHFER